MRWSLPIGSILGIRLRLHWTLLAFLAWLGYEGFREAGWIGAAQLVGMMAVMFLCILLHELGHSVFALRFGVKVPSITLLPIGGVASMGSIPEKPAQEFVIAIAGPMVNVIIAAGLGLWTGWMPTWSELWRVEEIPNGFVEFVQIMNLRLVAFNMIPAFPMDGGRVFRALLASIAPYETATFIAAFVGRFIAILFIVFGSAYSFLLPLIGLFVFFGAGYENRWVKLRVQLRGRTVAGLMRPVEAVVGPDDRLSDVLSLIHRVRQLDFPVVEQGRVVGLLSRDAWMDASEARRDDPPVREIMDAHFIIVRPQLELVRLIYDRKLARQPFFPVVEEGHLAGYIVRADIDAALNAPVPPPLPAIRQTRRVTVDLG